MKDEKIPVSDTVAPVRQSVRPFHPLFILHPSAFILLFLLWNSLGNPIEWKALTHGVCVFPAFYAPNPHGAFL
jgi:hypothetical protein